MRSDIAAEAVDAAYEELGVSALHRVNGSGAPTAVTVMRLSPDRLSEFNRGQFVVGSTIIKVRFSDVPLVRKNDTFTVNGSVFVVYAEPLREDPARLEWTCWAKAA